MLQLSAPPQPAAEAPVLSLKPGAGMSMTYSVLLPEEKNNRSYSAIKVSPIDAHVWCVQGRKRVQPESLPSSLLQLWYC